MKRTSKIVEKLIEDDDDSFAPSPGEGIYSLWGKLTKMKSLISIGITHKADGFPDYEIEDTNGTRMWVHLSNQSSNAGNGKWVEVEVEE